MPPLHLPRFFAGFTISFLVPLVLSAEFRIETNDETDVISVFRSDNSGQAVLVQNARSDFRPYIHPLLPPDGKGRLTEYSPGHHKHQTGLYWGFTSVNGRDYFHHPDGQYWRRVSARVVSAKGRSVAWETVYDLLGENGEAVMTETQKWKMHEHDDDGKTEFILDLEWSGQARTEVTVGRYDYGGLFLRMPWRPDIPGEVVNTARQRNKRAEGQRAMWLDLGLQVEGREDLAHIAIFDHPENDGFPLPWRVDDQMGVGPVRARLGDWKFAKGEKKTVKHQFRVYTGALNDVGLTKKWGGFSGQGGTYALWGLAQREGREAKLLSPAEAVEAMTVKEGYKVNAYANEPMITQPMAFCWDDRGRMWVAENRDYETRGRGFSNSGDSRILILEDTDRDGVADSRKVFLEGIPFPAGIAVGMGGLWLGAPPNLLFVPDRDGDDKADGDDIEIRLTGWGIRDRHETLNSFHWGPDGWLYGCQGYATPSLVGKPKGKGRLYKHREAFPKNIPLEGEGTDINGGVWRYHPTKDRFEVVAHGFSNPWGIDYDAKGNFFITACVIPHMFHVVQGGIFHRQGGRHFNPYVYSDIRTIVDHRHRSAHGGARIYLADAFPKDQHGRLFMANIHEHAVLTDILTPHGSGFVASHGDDFLLANNAQWIGFSIEIGPEGGVYVLDWHDADICGKDVVHKETGRVFRIMPEESRAKHWDGRFADLAKFSDEQLIGLQRSPSAWHARRARLVLQNRANKNALDARTKSALYGMFSSETNGDWRLCAMWALHVCGGWEQKTLVAALEDRDPHIRGWAVELLCEDKNPGPAVEEALIRVARREESPVVRLDLAAALQRVDANAAWQIAALLADHAGDSDDHNIPKMIWFGVEPLVPKSPERAVALARASKIPLLSRFIARRLVDDGNIDPVVADLSGASEPALREILRGLRDGLEGKTGPNVPTNWSQAYATLSTHNDRAIRDTATALGQIFGDADATRQLVGIVRDAGREVEDRRRALQSLVAQRHPVLRDVLMDLLEDEKMRRNAIRAMSAYEEQSFADALMRWYPKLSADEKQEALQTFASRPVFGRKITEALKSGEMPRREVPAYVARQLRRVVGNGFVEVWGPIDELSDDRLAALARYRKLLTSETLARADHTKGKVLFVQTCAACHKMYGEGGEVGPEITGANRGDLNYLLDNILNPSGEIQDDYKLVIITTNDGRTYSGNVVRENEREVALRTISGEDTIAKSRIQSREILPGSMMPEGLLGTMEEADVINLIGYLQTAREEEK